MVKVDYAFGDASAAALLAQGGPVTVPDAHLLFTADFSRSGHDLLLTGEDGNTLLIVDYFGPNGPVDLVSPDGAVLSSSTVKSLAGPLGPGQYAQAGDQQPAEMIGKVVTLEGSASAQRTDGTVVELSIGDSVALGDVVQTGSGANLGIAFLDGSVFSLSAGSRMVLDNLVYQAGGSDNALTFSLVQGTFSFVAGQIAPTGEMKIETPVATMGIRGTSGIVKVASIDGAVIFRVIPDPGSGHLGAYVLYSLIDGTILATVDAADLQWLLTSPTGTPTTEPADPTDQQIIDDLIQAFERRNAGLDDGSNDGQDGGTRVVTIGSGIDTGIDPLDPNSVDAQLVDLFAGLSDAETEEPDSAAADTTDTTTVINTGNTPVIGNQPASFAGDVDGDAVEDAGTATSGQVIVSDPNSGESGVRPQTNAQGQFGTFTIDANGNWTYVLNNANPAVQALPGGATATDSFVVTSTDGSASITIVITITGTNDVPTITGSTAGNVVEDGATTASGVITVSDPDTGESTVAPQSGVAGNYGTFAITAAGAWTYVVNNANAAVQALPEGATLTESFTVFSADGTASETIVVTINGTNDGAEIGGVATGSVTEDAAVTEEGDLTAQGSLTITDPDSGQASFVAQASVAGTYGTFTLDAAGNWTYTADNSQQAIQQLGAGQSLTDSFTAVSSDGSASQVVTVTINGSNDAAVASPVELPSMVEDDYGPTITLEDVLSGVSDPDGPYLSLVNVTIQSGEGTVAYNGEGGWTYTPPENYSGDVVFNYTVSDGSLESTSTASLHIEAVADAPIVTAATVSSGFETGDFTGWLTLGSTSVQTVFTGFGEPYDLAYPEYPTEGSYMAVLGTDGASEQEIEAFLGLAPGTLDNQGNGDATVGSTAVFELQVSAGDVVTFDWNFLTNDYLPYNDYAVLTINGQFIELADVASLENTIGNVSQTGWTTYTYTVTQTGTLTIGFAVVDVGDAVVDSVLLVDNVQVNSGSSIPLDINAGLADTDGSETLAITIAGVPEDATLSAGTDLGDGVWSLTPEQLVGLSIKPGEGFSGDIDLTVTATATESSNGDTASTTATIHLTVNPSENSNPTAVDDHLPLTLDLTVSPHGEPVTIASAQLLENDSDPDMDSISILSVPATSQQGASLALDSNGDIVYSPPPSFNSLHGHGSIADQFSYTITDGSGGTSVATVYLEVSGNQQSFSFALFSSSETSAPEETFVPTAGFSESRRLTEGKGAGEAATMHAIAAAAGLAGMAPHWAHAQTHHPNHDPGPAHAQDGNGRGSSAEPGGPWQATGNQPDFHRLMGPSEPAHSPGADHPALSLSDIIGQHFESLLPAHDAAGPESEGKSGTAVERQPAAEPRAHDPGNSSPHAPQAEGVSQQDAQSDAQDKGGTAKPDVPGHHFDGIVDFANLPSFHAPVNDIDATAPPIPDLKHGDFAGIVDFSRDLLPEPQAGPMPDRGGFKGESFAHAPVHEPIHVAVNDVIQSLAHDAEAASQHHPH
ncbi:MAG: VCBS domain-containing protein [Rhizobiales bacterium]|nr:VCBS domain-containing protein [Hyphomicrobiales bacterium]